MVSPMKTEDFWYDLPEELIAQTPLQQRDSSRLLVLDRKTGKTDHKHFYDILDYLQPGDCLVMNDSRVLPARLLGKRPTGGAVELLLLKDKGDNLWECLAKPGRKLQVGQEVIFGDGELTATIRDILDDGNRLVEFHYTGIFFQQFYRKKSARNMLVPVDIQRLDLLCDRLDRLIEVRPVREHRNSMVIKIFQC